MTVFRAEGRAADPARIFHRRPALRLPGNVPLLVDNIWEWLRPDGMPSRRASVFAAPTPELALASTRPDAVVHRVVFEEPTDIAQIVGVDDERDHPDVRALRTLVQSSLADAGWMHIPLDGRRVEATLFMPWAGKADLDRTFAESPILSEIAAAVRDACTLWRDVEMLSSDALPHPRGEMFFEPPAAGYRLVPA